MKRFAASFAFCFCLLATEVAVADSQREQFNQMVEQLRKTPNDTPLLEQIIKLAQELKSPPVIPENARRAFVKGNAALSGATGADDYARAVQNYLEAMSIAPWWGDIYYNNAKARELQKDYARSIVNIKHFLLTNPPPVEERKARDYMYVMEDKQEKLTKEQAAIDDHLIVPGVRIGRIHIGMKIEDALKLLGPLSPYANGVPSKVGNRPTKSYVSSSSNSDQAYAVRALVDTQEVVMISVGSSRYHTADGINIGMKSDVMLAKRGDLKKMETMYVGNTMDTYCDLAGMRLTVIGNNFPTEERRQKIHQIDVLPAGGVACDSSTW